MSVSYYTGGRFGNNIYQYIATKLICKLTNKSYQYIDNCSNETKKSSFIITDSNFYDVYDKKILIEQNNIILSGYFQSVRHINENIDYIRELFTETNEENINSSFKVKDIVLKIKEQPLINDKLVVHVRLDDFYHQGHNSEIIDPKYLKEYIKEIMMQEKITLCVFIVDKPKQEWEQKYIDFFKDINIEVQSNSILEDFSLIYNSEYTLLCRSTFGWISTLLSTINKKNWFPENDSDKMRVFNPFNKNSIHYKPTYYSTRYL